MSDRDHAREFAERATKLATDQTASSAAVQSFAILANAYALLAVAEALTEAASDA